jgi:lipoprotein-anchoring transpeptidase ErfK/SrfK
MWVMSGSRRTYGPVPIRTGRKGLTTPAGAFRIQDKKVTTTSSYFKVKLPYWQRFYRDMGFHQTTTYLYDSRIPGSHGCINLLPTDAQALFRITRGGTPVHIFGRKPGS